MSKHPRPMNYQVGACGDPDCGPHVLFLDKDGAVMCELVLSKDGAKTFAAQLMATVELIGLGAMLPSDIGN